MLLEQGLEQLAVRGALDGLERHAGRIDALVEQAITVEHERRAARHAGGEVAAGRAEDHGDATRHVLAAVVADALDDGGGARVAHAEALAGATA